MKYAIDTDVAIDYMRGDPYAISRLLGLAEAYVTPATVAELFYGAYRSDRPEKKAAEVAHFLEGCYRLIYTLVGSTKQMCPTDNGIHGFPAREFAGVAEGICHTPVGTPEDYHQAEVSVNDQRQVVGQAIVSPLAAMSDIHVGVNILVLCSHQDFPGSHHPVG